MGISTEEHVLHLLGAALPRAPRLVQGSPEWMALLDSLTVNRASISDEALRRENIYED